ncbi:hypothetical protein GCM10020000_18750 [Streptomyces olivoverticillatus]
MTVGIEAFEEQGGVEAAGAAADHGDAHGQRPPPCGTPLGGEGRVEFGVVGAVHQQRLRCGVQLDGGGERHVQLGGEQGLGLGVGEGGAVGEAAGEGLCGGGRLSFLGEGADEADALGLFGLHGLAEHQQPGGVAEADDAGQQVGGAHVASGEADLGEEEGEARGGVGDAEVGGEGEHGPGSRGDPVQGGDHRERAFAQRPYDLAGHAVEVEQAAGVHGEGGADDVVDVASGAEAAACPAEHEGPYGSVAGELGEEVAQVGVGAEGEGVEFGGAGEGDGGDTVVEGQA